MFKNILEIEERDKIVSALEIKTLSFVISKKY